MPNPIRSGLTAPLRNLTYISFFERTSGGAGRAGCGYGDRQIGCCVTAGKATGSSSRAALKRRLMADFTPRSRPQLVLPLPELAIMRRSISIVIAQELGHNLGADHSHCSNLTTGVGPASTSTLDQCFNGESALGCCGEAQSCSAPSIAQFHPGSGQQCVCQRRRIARRTAKSKLIGVLPQLDLRHLSPFDDASR